MQVRSFQFKIQLKLFKLYSAAEVQTKVLGNNRKNKKKHIETTLNATDVMLFKSKSL